MNRTLQMVAEPPGWGNAKCPSRWHCVPVSGPQFSSRRAEFQPAPPIHKGFTVTDTLRTADIGMGWS